MWLKWNARWRVCLPDKLTRKALRGLLPAVTGMVESHISTPFTFTSPNDHYELLQFPIRRAKRKQHFFVHRPSVFCCDETWNVSLILVSAKSLRREATKPSKREKWMNQSKTKRRMQSRRWFILCQPNEKLKATLPKREFIKNSHRGLASGNSQRQFLVRYFHQKAFWEISVHPPNLNSIMNEGGEREISEMESNLRGCWTGVIIN